MRGTADGLKITAGSSWVHGLVINRFNGDGIELATNGGNLIEGNFIGTDPTGTITDPDGVCGTFDELWNYYGVRIDGSSGNTIGSTAPFGRNVISGNLNWGVYISGSGATGNTVQANYIGTDVTGSADLGNGSTCVPPYGGGGVSINWNAAGNTIGGWMTGQGNLISGNGYYGIDIGGNGPSGNLVQGNHIGTNVMVRPPCGTAGTACTCPVRPTTPLAERSPARET